MNKLIVTFLALMATVTGVALAADANAGKAIYEKQGSCINCHGKDGAAPNEALGKMLQVTIPTLADAQFQASKTDDDIKNAITKGHGKMPAQKNVPADQVDNVVAYVRSLKK
ncbi:MAG TPA: cytochrome c [Bryobacteraceae bacterium]|jgi:mono/diheme cytochrome c family protein|nr:cytochrome c [Bryobacteraceae bacterium]